jgi:hypothetical protein
MCASRRRAPPVHRPFAVALGTLLMHAIGDVPMPIFVGALKVTTARRDV